ncbi:MAG: glycosyltransferase family 4 protein [Acidovorax sp.]
MHIGYFVSGWPLSARASGIVTYIDAMKQELESAGHEVSIFCASLEPATGGENIHKVEHRRTETLWSRVSDRILANFRPDQGPYLYGKSIANTVAQVHSRKPLDVFEVEESFGWSKDLEALGSFPVVVRLHGPTFLVQQHSLGAAERYRVEREGAALQQARFITAPARCTMEETISRYALKPLLARTIPNPYPLPAEALQVRQPMGDSQELLFVGRFDTVKGADKLLQVFAILAERHPKLHLIFAGPDIGIPQPGGELLKFGPYVERHMKEDVRQRIQFLGQQTPDQIRALRARATMTLVTSRWENQPYVILEAMAQQCPVVAFAAGGIAEVVQHERNGLSAPPGQVDELARQAERLLLEPELREELARAGLRYVSSVHNPATVAAALVDTYEAARSAWTSERSGV